MRWLVKLSILAMLVSGTMGCLRNQSSKEINPKDIRPDLPEEYKLPPTGAYMSPNLMPRELLNQTGPRRDPRESGPDGLPANTNMPRMGGSRMGQ